MHVLDLHALQSTIATEDEIEIGILAKWDGDCVPAPDQIARDLEFRVTTVTNVCRDGRDPPRCIIPTSGNTVGDSSREAEQL